MLYFLEFSRVNSVANSVSASSTLQRNTFACHYPFQSVSTGLSFGGAVVVAVVGVTVTALGASAQVADTVLLRSGNPVVGEVEELRRGTLDLDTEEMGVVGIDWEDIAFLTSSRIFEVTDIDGFQYLGSLGSSDLQGTLVVALAGVADTLAFSDVVEITYTAQGFLAKTSGFVARRCSPPPTRRRRRPS